MIDYDRAHKQCRANGTDHEVLTRIGVTRYQGAVDWPEYS